MEKASNYLKLNERHLKEGALHQNFYENWLTAEMVADYADAVRPLVEKLKTLAR